MKLSFYLGLLSLLASSTFASRGPVDGDLPGSSNADGKFNFALQTYRSVGMGVHDFMTVITSNKCDPITSTSISLSYSTQLVPGPFGGQNIKTKTRTVTIATSTCSDVTTDIPKTEVDPPSGNDLGVLFKVLDDGIEDGVTNPDLSGICYSADTPVISLRYSLLNDEADWGGYFGSQSDLTFTESTPGDYLDNTGFSFTSDGFVAMDQSTEFMICGFLEANGHSYAKVYHKDILPMHGCKQARIRYFSTTNTC